MKTDGSKGATLAVAAISIILAGAAPPAMAASTGKVHCLGANSCKGKADCHSPKNGCKGMNSCKGQGWVFKDSVAACEEAGGKAPD